MELINKLEKLVLGWVKDVPHLPESARKWLGINAWWIILIVTIISGIAFLAALSGFFTYITLLGAASTAYYINASYTSIAILKSSVSLVFLAITVALLAFSIQPLKERKKKGWVLLFFTLLVEALSIVVGAVLSFSFGGFIIQILFGAIGIAIGAYFITEIHSQFAHPVKKTEKVEKKV